MKHPLFNAIFLVLVFWGMPLLSGLYLLKLDFQHAALLMIACGVPISLIYGFYLAITLERGWWGK